MKKLMVTGGLGFIGSYFVDLALPPSRNATADKEGFVLNF
jgi:hypothetical protein